jgi:hypothetical protein
MYAFTQTHTHTHTHTHTNANMYAHLRGKTYLPFALLPLLWRPTECEDLGGVCGLYVVPDRAFGEPGSSVSSAVE